MVLRSAIKLHSLKYYEERDHILGISLLKDHPGWDSTWQLLYIDSLGQRHINGNRFIYDYIYDEEISLKEAEVICPEVFV